MVDQAQGLRDLFLSQREKQKGAKEPAGKPRHHRVISFTSGKGGVGKTNLVTSFAQMAVQKRHRVLVMDADLGLGNIDVLLGLRPKRTLQDVLNGQAEIRDVLLEGPGGVTFLPGGSGIAELTALETAQKLALVDAINELAVEFDTLLVDTGAGISPNVLYFNQAATEVVTVVTPEPTSIADAYGMIKVLHQRGRKGPVYVLVNMARNGFEAVHVFQRLSLAAERFLGAELINLGWLPRDPRLESAVRQQTAFVGMYPQSKLASRLREMSTRLFSLRSGTGGEEGLARFWSDLVDQETSDLMESGPT
ncbi:MinD/ParA family protein [Thiohalorhabdus methylotrophus]|uniref:MinD/ParA family protein n=1 Tax=Thiohalorhabdus methylotrophus TaxID=3242694 RepID=A0ABV4TW52_9GAMM